VLLDQVRNEIRGKRYLICTEQEWRKLNGKLTIFAERRIKGKREVSI